MTGSFLDTLNFGILPRSPQDEKETGSYFWGNLSHQEAIERLIQINNLRNTKPQRIILYTNTNNRRAQFFKRERCDVICVLVLVNNKDACIYEFIEYKNKLVLQKKNSNMPKFSAVYSLIQYFEEFLECTFEMNPQPLLGRLNGVRPDFRFPDELIYIMARYSSFYLDKNGSEALLININSRDNKQEKFALIRLVRDRRNALCLSLMKDGEISHVLIQFEGDCAYIDVQKECVEKEGFESIQGFLNYFHEYIFICKDTVRMAENDFRLRFNYSEYNLGLSYDDTMSLLIAMHNKIQKPVAILSEQDGEFLLLICKGTTDIRADIRVSSVIINYNHIQLLINFREYNVNSYMQLMSTIRVEGLYLVTQEDQLVKEERLRNQDADEEVALIMAPR